MLRIKLLSSLGLSCLIFGSIAALPAMAGRYVLDQTPQTIERYFGRYWTRLTTTNASGDRVVTYTYSPRPLQRLFTGAENSTFKVIFVNNRAQQITLENMWTHDFDIPDAARFFEYVFAYSPPQSEYQDLGTETLVHGHWENTACLGDGVLTRYDNTGGGVTFFVTLSYDQRCEPGTPQQ